MTTAEEKVSESRPFEADVAKLLHLMVHSVYSDKSVFLRELIANAADACERLRYEAIADPALIGDDVKPRITLSLDAEQKRLTVEDNGIGMSRDELAEALGTIARSGTKAFLDGIEAKQPDDETALIGRFGVGFYSAFMVAERVEVVSRRAGTETAWLWSSDGKGTFAISPAALADAPARGTRVVLHLMDDAKTYAERFTIERLIKAQSGHVPVPIAIVEKAGSEPTEISDGAALWAKPKSEISAADYTAPRAGRTTRRSCSSPARGRSICSILTARVASSSTSSASSSPTTPISCRAICVLCAAWSTAPTCRSTSRARKSRRARSLPRSARV